MALTQQRLYGASISSFNCSLGWGSQTSNLTVSLVEDPVTSDNFQPDPVGSPVYFRYFNSVGESFSFGGLLQSYVEKNSLSGKPVFEVSIVDPREVLEGIVLIIDSYNGPTNSVPNVYNIYGFYEAASYGSSRVNANGMLWSRLSTGFNTLQLQSAVTFRGAGYIVDLSLLPALPNDYRIGGGVSLSLMEVISRVCEDAASDFFVRLLPGNIISVMPVSRRNQPSFGRIQQFIDENQEGIAISNERGVELRNETTTKFLVGGNKRDIFFQLRADGEEDNYTDDTIAQFYGLRDGNIIFPIADKSTEFNHTILLESKQIDVDGVGDYYITDWMELRCILGGQNAWESFLWFQSKIPGSIHEFKAKALGLLNNGHKDLVKVLGVAGIDDAEKLLARFDPKLFHPLHGEQIRQKDAETVLSHEYNVNKFYQYLYDYASEYYGRKFMVRVPDVLVKVDEDTNEITTSLEPTDGGYLEETKFGVALAQNLIPLDIDKLTDSNGLIECYVRFDNIEIPANDAPVVEGGPPVAMINKFDFSYISQDDIFINRVDGIDPELVENINKTSVFIRAQLDPKLIFLNRLGGSPRAVVTLSGPVYSNKHRKQFDGVVRTELLRFLATIDPLPAPGPPREAKLKEHNTLIGRIFTKFGAESAFYEISGLPYRPDMAAIPMESKVLTYGPWVASGANGKVEFEQDTTLVPWEFGSFTALNAAANAKVSEGLSFQQAAETGVIEIPDAPSRNLGDILISGGPYITNIDVSISNDGVRTTYRMETWRTRFGKLAKINADRVTKLSKELQKQRRESRLRIGAFTKAARIATAKNLAEVNKRVKPASSSSLICGELLLDGDTGEGSVNVHVMPAYNVIHTLPAEDWAKKAFCSLDALFTPFSTNTTDANFPHFESPLSEATDTVNDLNPYKANSPISKYTAKGDSPPSTTEHITEIESENLRSLALRGPIIIAGWGKDTNGKPVPNATPESPGDEYAENYMESPKDWKVGPLADINWDDERKVWTPGESASIKLGLMKEQILPRASGLCEIYGMTASGLHITSEEYVYDFLMVTGQGVSANTRVILGTESDTKNLYILSAACRMEV